MNTALACVAGLPDLDRLRELVERIKQILVTGGIGLALAASLVFLLAWVLSYLRRPAATAETTRILPIAAQLSSWAPALLTLVAGLGALVPALKPFVLQSFALAVVLAGFAWCLSVAAVVAGGSKKQLARARKALLLSGTPWYCLAVYLSTYL
ncbi:MAG: hypothetical protein JKY37_07640 [Nannocystaceae bacterium]|nr:hypothetical protein [Nannocystaceae bacterium]